MASVHTAEEVAEIVRRARRRALDELLTLAKGEKIERGCGSDAVKVFARIAIALGMAKNG